MENDLGTKITVVTIGLTLLQSFNRIDLTVISHSCYHVIIIVVFCMFYDVLKVYHEREMKHFVMYIKN